MDLTGRGKVFEYCVLYHPKQTKDEAERGIVPKSILVKPITSTLALSDKEVAMKVARELPDDYVDKFDDVQIIIRPLQP